MRSSMVDFTVKTLQSVIVQPALLLWWNQCQFFFLQEHQTLTLKRFSHLVWLLGLNSSSILPFPYRSFSQIIFHYLVLNWSVVHLCHLCKCYRQLFTTVASYQLTRRRQKWKPLFMSHFHVFLSLWFYYQNSTCNVTGNVQNVGIGKCTHTVHFVKL